MALTIESTYLAAQELEQAGSKPASLKYALQISSLSGQKSLKANGQQARAIAKFVETPATSAQEIDDALSASGNKFYCTRNVATIWHIQQLDNSGQLEPFKQEPENWQAWRKGLYGLLSGHGCSLKMISFAALLMWPTKANLAIIDSHMLKRFAVKTAKGKQVLSARPKVYFECEGKLQQELAESGENCPLGIFHWMRWSEQRQATGAEEKNTIPESHALLSPRDY